MPESPTATDYLRRMARQVAAPYAAHPQCRAIILTGSAAEGLSDNYSDLDIILYYDELPSEDELRAARERAGGGERSWLVEDREAGALMEAYPVRGVECQCAHSTVAQWERELAEILEHHVVDTPLHKALDGMLHAIPLHGEPLIRQWQAHAAAFPPELAEAMVRHYLKFFPLWSIQDRLASRDAALWIAQGLNEAAYNILGVLAGLNRRYFTTFQFKRMRRFVGDLAIAPERLSERLEQLVLGDQRQAGEALAALVAETAGLVERHMPQVDTQALRRRLGQRAAPWVMEWDAVE
jgi:predicted nucleotidyltransferase